MYNFQSNNAVIFHSATFLGRTKSEKCVQQRIQTIIIRRALSDGGEVILKLK